MIKNKNEITNHIVQKYIKQARKELKQEGLITDNEILNLAKVITRTYINFVTEICTRELVKEYRKLYKKSIGKIKIKNES